MNTNYTFYRFLNASVLVRFDYFAYVVLMLREKYVLPDANMSSIWISVGLCYFCPAYSLHTIHFPFLLRGMHYMTCFLLTLPYYHFFDKAYECWFYLDIDWFWLLSPTHPTHTFIFSLFYWKYSIVIDYKSMSIRSYIVIVIIQCY